MMWKWYIINELRLTWSFVKDASVSFWKGLNVISWPSNTWKSYILECINYMLWSSKKPKAISQSKWYEFIYLEIQIPDSLVYTLKSDLKWWDFEVYQTSIEDLSQTDIKTVKLKREHKAWQEDEISFFLLRLCNLHNRKLLYKKDWTTHELTYRNIARLILIKETEITKEGSPILSWQYPERTKEESLLKFLLTWKEDSDIQKNAADTTISNRKWKLQVLESMIGRLGWVDNLYDVKELKNTLKDLNNDIDSISIELDELNTSINDITSKKIELIDEIRILQSEEKEFQLDIVRSEVLSKHYNSDIQRLSATIESWVMLTDNDHERNCPLCSNKIKSSCSEIDIRNIIDSCISERKKIFLLKDELVESRKVLRMKLKWITEKTQDYQEKLAEVNNEIDKKIASKLSDKKLTLKYKYEKKNEIINKIKVSKELKLLLSQKDKLENFLENNKDIKIDYEFIKSQNTNGFCHVLQSILEKIQFPIMDLENNKISISLESLDLIINGEDRNIPWKWYRAITYSVFIIALMEYARKHDININSIILDSPILSYKEAEIDDIDESEYVNIWLNLYDFLSTYKWIDQVIILENKEPQESILNHINHIHFTRNANNGRYGFIPLVKS